MLYYSWTIERYFERLLAVYQSNEKNNFLDRKEFKGSILEIYDTIIDYLKNNTATYGLINTSVSFVMIGGTIYDWKRENVSRRNI